MGKRDDLIPEDLLLHLRAAVPGFSAEQERHQVALAAMLWAGTSKRRAHSRYDEHFSFTHVEMDEAFGRRGFGPVNRRLGLFVVRTWSVEDHFTKGYALTEMARRVQGDYLAKAHREPTRLLYSDAAGIKALKTAPPAVASRDVDGATTTAWRGAKALNAARVNLDVLHGARDWMIEIRDQWLLRGRPPVSAFLPGSSNPEALERLIEAISRIIRLARIDITGAGYILHRYVQSKSGRLYAKGVSLQNAPTPVKQAALAGQWEYDFANCHFTFLDQMAVRHGYDCTAIRHYLANKGAIRTAIADKVGITKDDAKVCLLATLYGAKASLSYSAAIPEAIGAEAAARVYKTEEFKAIKGDIQAARRAVLKGWPRTRTGMLVNDFKKAISCEVKSEKRLAHLIQGAEALALKTVIDLHPDDISLVQHDGWATPIRLDRAAIELAVHKATGHRLELEEKHIRFDPEDYLRRSWNAK